MKNFIVTVAMTLVLTGCNHEKNTDEASSKSLGETASAQNKHDMNSDEEISKTLVETAKLQKKSLPVMVDDVTRWDDAIAGPGRNWTYMYTIVVPESKNLNNQKINDYLGNKLRNSVCIQKEMELFVENDVKLKYIYHDLEGNLIGKVDFNAGDCKK